MNNLLFAILFFALLDASHAGIRLASFYVGETSEDSNVERIADLIQLNDFVAIQGLRETKIIDALINQLFLRGDFYKFVASRPTDKNGRRYAFVWRDKTIKISALPTFRYAQFEHQALVATFRSNNFHFTAINFLSFSTEENKPKLLKLYNESLIESDDELDVIFFTALPTKTLPDLTPLIQVIPKHRHDLKAMDQLFPAIYLNMEKTLEFTGNAQQADSRKLIFNSNNNPSLVRFGWAEFENDLIVNDPTPSVIKNHTWGKTKNSPKEIVPYIK